MELKGYFEHLTWWSLIDLISLTVFIVLFSVFFYRKRNKRLGTFFLFYALGMVAVDVVASLFFTNELFFTRQILHYIALIFIITSAVVYQTDLKRMFARVNRTEEENIYAKTHDSRGEDDLRFASGEIVKACQNLAKNNIGALIVVCPTIISTNMLDTGIRLNSVLSAPLLESIFNPNAPLHDGAVIVKNNMVLAAGCFLPLSQNPAISKDLGTRHRAAIGITEESDVLTIVVSEETGIISTVRNGEIRRYMTSEKLIEVLDDAFGIADLSRGRKRTFKGKR